MSINLVGLASGLDTTSMINQLMQIERQPYNRMQTRKDNLSSEQSIYRSINTKLSALQDAAFNLTLASTFQQVSSTSSNPQYLTVTSGANASTGTYNVQVNTTAKQMVVQSNEFVSANNDLSGKSITFTYMGASFTVNANGSTNGDILENFKKDINSKNIGITASVIETSTGNKRLILTSKNTGTANALVFQDGTAATDPADPSNSGSTKTFVDQAASALFQFNAAGNIVQPSSDADFTVNNVRISGRSSNSISDVISGVTLNLAAEGGSSTVTVGQDADKIASSVESFVNAYNEVINTIRSNTAKGQPLQGDPTLANLQDQLFNMFVKKVGSSSGFQYMFDIGLEVDKGKTKASDMTGTISFDKTAFKAKLAENPDAVANMFNFDNDPLSTAVDANDGIAQYTYSNMQTWTAFDGIMSNLIKGYDSEISTIDQQMNDLNDRLNQKQDQLKLQFTNMEVALSNLKSQQQWLTGQLAQFTK